MKPCLNKTKPERGLTPKLALQWRLSQRSMVIVPNGLSLLSSCCSVQCCRVLCGGSPNKCFRSPSWSLPLPCSQPPHCVPDTYSNATLWYKIFTTARDANTKYAQDYNPFWCYKGAIGKVYHALNPKLTVIVPDVSETSLCVSVTVCVCTHASQN